MSLLSDLQGMKNMLLGGDRMGRWSGAHHHSRMKGHCWKDGPRSSSAGRNRPLLRPPAGSIWQRGGSFAEHRTGNTDSGMSAALELESRVQ